MKLLNAFSLNMLAPLTTDGTIYFKQIDVETTQAVLIRSGEIESYVGHQSTADIFSKVLHLPIECNRQNVVIKSGGERLIVGQYIGDRLPEGATELPEGATIKWFHVEVF